MQKDFKIRNEKKVASEKHCVNRVHRAVCTQVFYPWRVIHWGWVGCKKTMQWTYYQLSTYRYVTIFKEKKSENKTVGLQIYFYVCKTSDL